MLPCASQERIEDLEKAVKDLEMVNIGVNHEIKNLVKKLDMLVSILIKIGYVLLTGLLSFLVYLAVYWVKGA